jgi:flavodoxin
MNILIIYKSYHRMNTEKVAKAMAETMTATLQKVEEAKPDDLSKYDLIGFGSGIYGGKYHKDMVSLVEKIPGMEKNVFLFSTSGKPQEKYEKAIKELLIGKGFRIVGEFRCPGVVGGPLGISLSNKGHPDEKDLADARAFANGLLSA